MQVLDDYCKENRVGRAPLNAAAYFGGLTGIPVGRMELALAGRIELRVKEYRELAKALEFGGHPVNWWELVDGLPDFGRRVARQSGQDFFWRPWHPTVAACTTERPAR